MATAAFQYLLTELSGNGTKHSGRSLLIRPELIVRSSTAPPAGGLIPGAIGKPA
jgi:DNA-binding LacI/PurR family transcriptional regulator